MPPKYNKRRDVNHWTLFIQVEKYIKKNGLNASVIDTSLYGMGFPDFIVIFNDEKPATLYFEVKNADEYWKLTEDEMTFFQKAWASYVIVESAKDAVSALEDFAEFRHLFASSGSAVLKELAETQIITWKQFREVKEQFKKARE